MQLAHLGICRRTAASACCQPDAEVEHLCACDVPMFAEHLEAASASSLTIFTKLHLLELVGLWLLDACCHACSTLRQASSPT